MAYLTNILRYITALLNDITKIVFFTEVTPSSVTEIILLSSTTDKLHVYSARDDSVIRQFLVYISRTLAGACVMLT